MVQSRKLVCAPFHRGFERERENLFSEKEEEFRKAGELKKREIVTDSRVRAKKELHNRKRQIIEEIFNAVVEKLKRLGPEEYACFMERLLQDAVGTKSEVLSPSEKESVFTEDFVKKLNARHGWKLTLGPKTARIAGGFLLKEKDYETVVDWLSIKESIRHKEEDRIIAELFGNEGPAKA